MKRKTVHITFSDEVLSSIEQGQRLANSVFYYLKDGHNVVVDFNGVSFLSDEFITEGLGKLFNAGITFNHRIGIKNLPIMFSDIVKEHLLQVVQSNKEYETWLDSNQVDFIYNISDSWKKV